MAKKNVERDHEPLSRSNTKDNPIILPSATVLRQPKGFPFHAQTAVSNITQAKVLVKIIERLQEPIEMGISNKRYKENPMQLPLFADEPQDTIQLDFEMSAFGVDNTNYRNLKKDILNLTNFKVVKDTVYFNTMIGEEVEAKEIKSLIYSVILPDKYQRYVTLKSEKDVAKLLVTVGKEGFTKFLSEIAMNSSSKYTLLVYQLISGWKDRGGFTMTIDNFKERLGISNKYKNWADLRARVLNVAYKELHENADIWFEYSMEKDKNGKPYKLNFKLIEGYIRVEGKQPNFFFDLLDQEPIKILEVEYLSENAKQALSILKEKVLISDENILGEIINDRLKDFNIWYNANTKKISGFDNPAGLLMTYLGMLSTKGWKPQKWSIKYHSEVKPVEPISVTDYSDISSRIKESVILEFGEQIFNIWFKPLSIISIDKLNKVIQFSVPSMFVYEKIESEYVGKFSNLLNGILEESYTINYIVIPKKD